ncbi:MAG: glycosyltransferase [Fimbriimonadales bacterium]|nr:glycosyltransferase [Fimbriimonadales bacterium]
MRIVHIVDLTDPQGTERHLLELAQSQIERGFDVLAICPPRGWLPSALKQCCIPIYLQEVRRKSPLSLLRIRRRIASFEPDVIHAHSERSAAIARLLTKPRGRPIVATVHIPRNHPAYRHLTLEHGFLIAVSHFLRAELIEYGIPDERIVTVLNSTILASTANVNTDATIRSELGIPEEKLLFAMVARYCEDKGQLIAVEALSKLDEEVRAKVHILFAGPCDEGWDKRVADSVRDLGLDDFVTLLGPVDSGANLIGDSDVLVLPSAREALPISILEAMALGKPVIATDVGGISDALVDGETGLFIDRDASSLAGAMRNLATDHSLRKRMGVVARRRAEELFAPNRMIDEISAVYDRAINAFRVKQSQRSR